MFYGTRQCVTMPCLRMMHIGSAVMRGLTVGRWEIDPWGSPGVSPARSQFGPPTAWLNLRHFGLGFRDIYCETQRDKIVQTFSCVAADSSARILHRLVCVLLMIPPAPVDAWTPMLFGFRGAFRCLVDGCRVARGPVVRWPTSIPERV